MTDPPESTAGTPPEEQHEPAASPSHRRFDRKTMAPVLAIAGLVLVPIAIWAASSGGNDDKLRIDQNISYVTGGPEIVVAIPEKYNYMSESGNKANVVLVCYDVSGKILFQTNQEWPFINEPGYDLPHIHQPVSDQQLKEIASCTVKGIKHKLTGNFRRSRKV
jgi:hypothetical protein